MAETSTATPPVEEKTPGKIVSAGIPQKLEVFIPAATPAAENTDTNNNGVGGGKQQCCRPRRHNSDKHKH